MTNPVSTDTWNATFAWGQTTPYPAGSTISGAVTGGDVLTTTTNQAVGPLTLTLTAADGATQTITTTAATAQVVGTTPQPISITKVVDNSANPLVWTINGLSISATAP